MVSNKALMDGTSSTALMYTVYTPYRRNPTKQKGIFRSLSRSNLDTFFSSKYYNEQRVNLFFLVGFYSRQDLLLYFVRRLNTVRTSVYYLGDIWITLATSFDSIESCNFLFRTSSTVPLVTYIDEQRPNASTKSYIVRM